MVSGKWEKENPEKVLAYARRYYHEKWIPKNREKKLVRRHGIDIPEYNRLFQIQGGRCAICKRHEIELKTRSLCVDHNHKTGRVRGLLCLQCNGGLGMFFEDMSIIQEVISYLKKHSEENI